MPRRKTDDRTCFVISPIGAEDSQERKHADRFFDNIVREVVTVEPHLYAPIRADHIPDPGIITNQVIRLLLDAPLVIADLTFQNANVFYELAIRHGVKKPVIQFVADDGKIPFDVGGLRTIRFKTTVAGIRACRKDLAKHLVAIARPNFKVESPLTIAQVPEDDARLETKNLRKAMDPTVGILLQEFLVSICREKFDRKFARALRVWVVPKPRVYEVHARSPLLPVPMLLEIDRAARATAWTQALQDLAETFQELMEEDALSKERNA